jgi:phosphoglycolate phosphatase
MKNHISLLVTDLDNTLWNWFDIWYAPFSAMLEEIVGLSGIDRATIIAEIRAVHQVRGTSEYTYLIQELPSLQKRHPGEDLGVVYENAIHSYRSSRRDVMALYPGVREVLATIKDCGTRIIAYTESHAYVSSYRLKKFGLDGVVDVLFSPPDHDFPTGITPEQMRTLNSEEYKLSTTEHRHTPRGHLKPDSAILELIVDEFGEEASSTVYVGDNLMKDIAMAQKVGIFDVWAKYGTEIDPDEYSLLQKVSHWSPEDIEREIEMKNAPNVTATFTLEDNFAEILNYFEFGA